jgi:hypothetical protein
MNEIAIEPRHETIGDLLEKNKEVCFIVALANVPSDKRVAYITNVFGSALRYYNQAETTLVATYVLKAVEDDLLTPVMNPDGTWKRMATDEDLKTVQKQQCIANMGRSRMALKLITEFTNVPNHTVLFLLTEVAEWCYRTPNEEDADSLFESFVKVFRAIASGGGPTIDELRKVLRGATGEEAPRARLVRHLRILKRMATKEHYNELDTNSDLQFLGRVLAVAITRNSTLEQILSNLSLVDSARNWDGGGPY